MTLNKFLRLPGALLIVLSLAACGGRNDPATGVTGKAAAAATSSSSPTTSTNNILAKGAELNRAELRRAAQSAPAGYDAGKAMAKAASSSLITAYRFYNVQTGSHFYTTNEAEKQNVLNTLPQFLYEGPAFHASGVAATGLSPVHRFYNQRSGVHFYTISEDEKALVQGSLPQFTYEGIAFYASQMGGSGLLAINRFFQSRAGSHFYTRSAAEAQNVRDNLSAVYREEGIAFYVIDPAYVASATVPLPHSGITASQCYLAGSDILVACNSVAAPLLNNQQDGHRSTINPMSYSEVPNPAGGTFARTECVKDNVTGLIWEGKTASGFRAGSNTYTNFDDPTQLQRYDGSAFVFPTRAEINALTNSVGHLNHVNDIALCGYTDWRLPTADELQSIVDYGAAYPGPTINTVWFPNTLGYWYWSSSSYVGYADGAWDVYFGDGYVYVNGRSNSVAVRLVRASQ
ncbi:DUF1566 domain-containing protein [Hydrogenophaga sp. RWCD_12]|uniref:DUF1566 domain-containing protein n=1 Tax=Hydrogenophaga sp. RWCD_12 TaxID=3391190 RepID=UPI003985539C